MNYITTYLDSAFLYFLMLIGAILFAFLAQHAKAKLFRNFFVTIVILILALPLGLRHELVGVDTWNYINIINSTAPNYIGELFYKYYEIGFQWVLKVLMFIFRDAHIVLLVISFITTALIVRTLWYFRDKISFSISVLLYFSLHYFQTYNITRQWLAIAITFFAVRYLFERKYFKYSLFVILAATIHSSAIICLVFVPIHMLITRKIPLKYKIFLGIITIGFAIFHNTILDILGISSAFDKYQYYLQGNPTIDIGFLFIVRFLVVLTAIWLLLTKRFKTEDLIFVKTIVTVYFFGVFSMFTGYISIYAVRIGSYMTIFEVLLLAMMCRTGPYSNFIRAAVILLCLYLFYSSLSVSSHGQMPYKLFFSN